MTDQRTEVQKNYPEDPLKTKITKFLNRPTTRREFIKGAVFGAAVVTAVTAGIGLPKFLETQNEAERLKRETLLKNLQNTQNKEQQEALLKDSISKFLTEQAAFEERSNGYLNEMYWKYQGSKEYSSYMESKVADEDRERAGNLLERGVVLLASWDLLQSGNPEHQFDSNGRLQFEGKTFAVNESYADKQIAFNVVRSKLSTLVEDDPQKLDLATEDYQALLKMAEIKPNLSVDQKCWVIMPQDWANALAKLTIFMDKNKIPPPQLITIEKKGGGLYEHGNGKKSSERQQVMILGSMDLPDVVFHEGGHYISDIQRTEKRLIGLPFTRKLPDFQTDFEQQTGQIQRLFFEEARTGQTKDLTDELDPYVSEYAASNPLEDFAETFKEFLGKGPFFRAKIRQLSESDPKAAEILAAKYEFMKAQVAGGTEFSFDGRTQRTEIAEFEQSRLDKEMMQTPINSPFNNEEYAKSRMRGIEGFEKASVELVIPKGDYAYSEALSDPDFWTDLFNIKVDSTSAVYPVPHFEIKGQFPVRIFNDRGDNKSMTEIQLDTEDPQSIKRFVEFIRTTDLPKLNITPRPFAHSEKTLSLFKRLDLSPVRINVYEWQASYPTQYVDQANNMYLHLQLNESTQVWEAKPLDVRRVSVHKKEQYGNNPVLGDNIYSPIRLGQGDIIVTIGSDGKAQKILTNNI